MQIDKKEAYTILTPTEKSTGNFYDSLSKEIAKLKNEHVLINFSENFNINASEILLFLDIATEKRENGTSFVLIISGIEIDDVPDEISVVPTMVEALDTLEMDAIERDLMGF
ncbi:MAG: hypothetical protein L3J14_01915 [Flavobacteriaceae bacterium]|nr:hypothetical protein [Flavobacteriaceae bacterium]